MVFITLNNIYRHGGMWLIVLALMGFKTQMPKQNNFSRANTKAASMCKMQLS